MAAPLRGKGRQHMRSARWEALSPTAPKLYTPHDRKLRLNLTARPIHSRTASARNWMNTPSPRFSTAGSHVVSQAVAVHGWR